MLRIRLHGRGGQGIKTASQILGTAAFLSGYQSQDFPLYGAERRGAPIVAFTRISPDPILERGPISVPDLILIEDETLLEDTQAAPLCGSDEQTVLFVNSTKNPQALKEIFNLSAPPVAYGLTYWFLYRQWLLKEINKEKILNSLKVLSRISGLGSMNCCPEVSWMLTFWAIRCLIPVIQKSHYGGA